MIPEKSDLGNNPSRFDTISQGFMNHSLRPGRSKGLQNIMNGTDLQLAIIPDLM